MHQYEIEKCRLKRDGILSRSQYAKSKDTLSPLGNPGRYIIFFSMLCQHILAKQDDRQFVSE